MDEKKARRRLKAIERELKYYTKKRDTFIEARTKADKKRKRTTKRRRMFHAIAYSAAISFIIIAIFTYFGVTEGGPLIIGTVGFGYLFIILFIFIYVIFEEDAELPFETELKGTNCIIKRLETERKRIFSEFPSLENEKISVRFGWTKYSFLKDIVIIAYTLYLIPYGYAWFTHTKFPYYDSLWPLWIFFLFAIFIMQNLEDRFLRNYWIKEELGVDPKKLYK